MKILFFLMLTANVALFMWEYKAGALAPISTTEIPAANTLINPDSILLLSELKNVSPEAAPLPAPASTDLDVKPDTSVSTDSNDEPSAPTDAEQIENDAAEPLLCYEIGPFANEKTYQKAISLLSDANNIITPLSKDDQVANKYMVYYPAAETPAQSQANLQMLKNQGFHDLWLLKSGKEQGQISLGVFSTEERALTMKNRMLAQGLKAEVKTVFKSKSQKYALLKSDSNSTERLDELQNFIPDLSVKQLPNGDEACRNLEKTDVEQPIETPEPADTTLIEKNSSLPVQCFEIGPFAGEKSYQNAIKLLSNVNGEIKTITREEQIAGHYMVYYPAAETQAQSKANLQMLEDRGYHDLWLLEKGEDQGRISLGVFDTEEGALAMKNRMLAQGLKVEVKIRYKTKSQKYALLESNSQSIEQLDALQKTNPQLTVKQLSDASDGCR